MSLLSTASTWTNEETTNEPNKKRQPTLRKTVRKMPSYMANVGQSDEYVSDEQSYQNTKQPTSPEDTQTYQDGRSSRVNELLNKITSVNVENDGNSLANFNPISNPELSQRKSHGPSPNEARPDETPLNSAERQNPYVQKNMGAANYSANNINLAKLSNYQMSYEQPSGTPYYAKMGLGKNTGYAESSSDNKLMEKINYMVHLMEEQQNEKTNNVMEEFILYTFLGVFVIYIVDSFSRSGKYIR